MPFVEIFLIIAGAALLGLATYLGKNRRDTSEPPPRGQVVYDLPAEKAEKFQTSIAEMLHELHTVSRDVTVDLEQKLAELKELLQLADTRLEELSQAGAEQQHAEEPTDEFLKIGNPNPGLAHAPLHSPGKNDNASPRRSERYERIYQMADRGLSIAEIARHEHMGKGEIQLILSLRRKD